MQLCNLSDKSLVKINFVSVLHFSLLEIKLIKSILEFSIPLVKYTIGIQHPRKHVIFMHLFLNGKQ